MSDAIRYNPQDALTTDWRTYFTDNSEQTFLLSCTDGDVEVPGKRMLFIIAMIMPLISRFHPISRKHLFLKGIYGTKVHAAIETQIARTLEETGYRREELGEDIIMTVNNVFNLQYTHLPAYVSTMDIFMLRDTVLQPEVAAALTPDYGDIDDKRIKRMEQAFKDQSKAVEIVMRSSDLSINVFRPLLLCNAVKPQQLLQFAFSAGPRTDTDETMLDRPVWGSFLSGLVDIRDLAIESRSAAKASYYNKNQMSDTQYYNRKKHLQGSAVWHLYPGDCGTQVFMTYTPTEKTVRYYLGMYYKGPGGGLLELTRERFDSVIGKTLEFRDPIPCLYTDGYCETCGGTLTRSFSRFGNVGFLSNVNTSAPVTQQVLSTKHLILTNAEQYDIPFELRNLFLATHNDIYIRPNRRADSDVWALGFPSQDISGINDLKYFDSVRDIPAARFSEIKWLHLGQLKEDGTIGKRTSRTAMGGESKNFPYLSPEVLSVIRNHPEDIIHQDKLTWILLRNIDRDAPILQCSVVNNSVVRYFETVKELVTTTVERYRSANDFMHDLMAKIWERVDTHTVHLSCMTKACLITSKKNFHIPVVTDPDNVQFGSLNRILPMRSIGTLFAFERVNQALNNPATYITPKEDGILDRFLNYQDAILQSMSQPEGYDRLIEEPMEDAA
jgi:hypothetical protein